MSIDAAIAANRFGLGATPGQLTTTAISPKDWLLAQIRSPAAAQVHGSNLWTSQQAFVNFVEYRRARARERQSVINPASNMETQAGLSNKQLREINLGARSLGEEMRARVTHAINTPAPFLERWVLFWSNYLTMAAKSLQTTFFAGPYEREAIRPNVLGKFADLLKASSLHAGMLLYLDQVRSYGPNAPGTAAIMQRGRNAGLNENLAREILELHTVGVDSGYSQADVTEFARALTGWTIPAQRLARISESRGEIGRVTYVDALHEPGERKIMGRTFAANGSRQALEILDWLATHPQTARRIAVAIATHFVSDVPPTELVLRLETNFNASGGDLAALAQTLINSPQAWSPVARKFKSPNEFLVSTLRASGTKTVTASALRNTFNQLGQMPFRAPSPKGWPDSADKWAAPDAILQRVDWSHLAADVIGETMSPLAFAQAALGSTLTQATRTAISRAQDSRQGIVMALMSPEFQRR